MRQVRQFGALLVLGALVALTQAQTTKAAASGGRSADKWSYTISVDGYLVENQISYGSPVFTADRDWLHLEARYNYEDQQTGSLWAGYNFSAGNKVNVELTPIFGVVFGNVTGVAPGYEFSLTYKKLGATSDGEYVFDTEHSKQSFYYSWDELTYAPEKWCHFGFAAQRTKAYHAAFEVQRGGSLGFAYRNLDYTTYVFDAGMSTPTIVLALTYKF